MTYEITGPYKSIDNAKADVEVLGLKGYKDDKIYVIAKEELANEIDDKVHATVIPTLREDDHQAEQHLQELLRKFDMSDPQVERFKNEIISNRIIIAVDPDDYRMGNDMDVDTEVLEEKLN